MSYIDLHTHTTASDGTDTPTQLVNRALSLPLSAIAITDHDTIDGIEEAIEATKNTDLKLIAGIELSCQYEQKEIHMLGYFIDYKNETLFHRLEQLKQARNLRNEQMRQKLEEAGMPLTMEEIRGPHEETVITRAHFARALQEKGYIKTKEEAFQKYIGDGCPCYVLKPEFTPKEAITLIKQANGLAVLAHPMLYKMGYQQLEQLIASLAETGLDGVEVYHSSHNTANSGQLREMIRPYHLLPTGGSDYHGENKKGVRLGVGHGGLRVSHALLDDLIVRHKSFISMNNEAKRNNL